MREFKNNIHNKFDYKFDVVTCNPPFFKKCNLNENMEKALARHEIAITLKEILELAAYHLKDKGKFYLVHRPERLEEILMYANNYNLHAKNIEMITTKNGVIMVLIKFVKNAKIGTKINITNIDGLTTYQNLFNKR